MIPNCIKTLEIAWSIFYNVPRVVRVQGIVAIGHRARKSA